MVIWLIGLSASGKTTIGKVLHEKLISGTEKWFFLDGDIFRHITGEDLGFTLEDREKNAYRISRFCEYLSSQNINVLACVLSIFHENQQYNRINIKDYREVYIDVKMDKLIERDNKQLYSRALNGELQNVVGVDIEYSPPFSPDIIIDNNIDDPDYAKYADQIIDNLNININSEYIYTKRNLLTKPHKYQYSKYEGPIFFKKYMDDRQLAINYIEYCLKIFEDYKFDILPLESGNVYDNSGNLIFRNYMLFLLSNKSDLQNEKPVMLKLIQRFEVSKKLYTIYSTSDYRKSSKVKADSINYILFSLALISYHSTGKTSEERLIYFNSLLKVNDIISSIVKDIVYPTALRYALKAIKGEMQIAKEYIC